MEVVHIPQPVRDLGHGNGRAERLCALAASLDAVVQDAGQRRRRHLEFDLLVKKMGQIGENTWIIQLGWSLWINTIDTKPLQRGFRRIICFLRVLTGQCVHTSQAVTNSYTMMKLYQ